MRLFAVSDRRRAIDSEILYFRDRWSVSKRSSMYVINPPNDLHAVEFRRNPRRQNRERVVNQCRKMEHVSVSLSFSLSLSLFIARTHHTHYHVRRNPIRGTFRFSSRKINSRIAIEWRSINRRIVEISGYTTNYSEGSIESEPGLLSHIIKISLFLYSAINIIVWVLRVFSAGSADRAQFDNNARLRVRFSVAIKIYLIEH